MYPKEVDTSQKAGHSRALSGTTCKPSSCSARRTRYTSPGITSEQSSLPSTSRTTNSSTLLRGMSDIISLKNDMDLLTQGTVNKWSIDPNVCVRFLNGQTGPARLPTTNLNVLIPRRRRRHAQRRVFNDRVVATRHHTHLINWANLMRHLILICLLFHALKQRFISWRILFRIVLFYLCL